MLYDVATDLIAARSQMAFTLGFHIVLACLGVGLPTIVLIANGIGLRRRDPVALLLARRWSAVMAVTFAVGAVTGTVLSFEMGLLWPVLMGRFGGAFGIPFAVEGLFFFLEAIFIAIYVYGWSRLSPRAHFLSGIPVAIAGIGGTFSVVAANSWMNQPAGYVLGPDGRVAAVAPLEVIFNRATFYEVPHMLIAAYMVTGFLLASVYAVGLLRGQQRSVRAAWVRHPVHRGRHPRPDPGRRRGRRGPGRLRRPAGEVRGDGADHHRPARTNRSRSAGSWSTGRSSAGSRSRARARSWPGFSPDTVITGFDQIPVDQRPPATVVHLAWDTMVGIGTALVVLGLWAFGSCACCGATTRALAGSCAPRRSPGSARSWRSRPAGS